MKKKWLWVIGLVLVIPIVALWGCAGGLTTVKSIRLDSQQVGIWVSGQGKATVVPDIAILRLGIESQEATVAEAPAAAAAAMGEVMTVLTDKDVAEPDIQTQYFNIRQITRWDDEEGQEIVIGYRVTNVVSAKIRDIEKVGAIIDAVAVAGGDLARIDSIGFFIDDLSVYYEEAREKAMADAEAKAEQMAELAGIELGKPTYISECIQMPPPIYPRAEFGMAPVPAPALPETPISPGEMEISLIVQVAYAILD